MGYSKSLFYFQFLMTIGYFFEYCLFKINFHVKTNKYFLFLEVRASALVIPELTDLQDDREKYLFAYSIHLSLQPQGCVINGISHRSCQLYWRHWLIHANDVLVSDVDGEAVIGMV
jgi:F-box protein 3